MPFVVKTFLEYQLSKIFSGAFDPQPMGPLPLDTMAPTSSALQQVAAGAYGFPPCRCRAFLSNPCCSP